MPFLDNFSEDSPSLDTKYISLLSLQLFAVWTVAAMGCASRASAAATPDGLGTSAISCPAMPAARNMVSARMEPVSALKDGMDAIALYVSVTDFKYYLVLYRIVSGIAHFSIQWKKEEYLISYIFQL